MSDNATQEGRDTPSETDISRMIRAEVDTWKPTHGPDWPGVLIRIAASGPPTWVVYAASSAALVVILVAAFLVGSYLEIGSLAPQHVDSQIHH